LRDVHETCEDRPSNSVLLARGRLCAMKRFCLVKRHHRIAGTVAVNSVPAIIPYPPIEWWGEAGFGGRFGRPSPWETFAG
jgi:hypothetical protein